MATQIKLTPAADDEYGFARLTVNGRYLGIPGRIEEIKKVKPGRWEGIASGIPFYIEGGRESGGGANDWFFEWQPLTGERHWWATGPKDALTQIDTA